MKKGKTYFTAAAKDDVRSLSEFLTTTLGNRRNAMKIVRKLLQFAERLGELAPQIKMGLVAPYLGPGIRLINHQRWILVYQYIPSGIEVLRICDASQDYMNWRL